MPTGSGLSLQLGMAEENTYVNEVQTLTGTPTAIFGLSFNGAATPVTIPIAATAAQIQAALEALPNIGTGGVVCTGGPLPAAVTVTFSGATTAGANQPALVVSTGVTGLTVATPTSGRGYGDAVTVTRFVEVNDESLKLVSDRIESKGIRPGNNVLRTDHFVIDKKGAAGDIEGEVPSKGFGLILAHAHGIPGVITTPVGGTLSRLHTYAGFGDNWNRSLTIQKGVPSVIGDAANVKAFTYPGSKITELDFDVDIDGFLMWKASIDAQDEQGPASGPALASASYAAAFDILNYQGGGVLIGGAPVDATKVGIKIVRPMATDRRFMRGTNLKKQPISNDLTTVTATFTLEFSDMSAYNRFSSATAAGAVSSLQLSFTGAIIEGAIPSSLSFLMPNARFDGDSPVVAGMDLVTIDITAVATYDGTNPALTTSYVTTDTAD